MLKVITVFVFVEVLIPICFVFGSNLCSNLFRKIFHVFFECLNVYFFSETAFRFRSAYYIATTKQLWINDRTESLYFSQQAPRAVKDDWLFYGHVSIRESIWTVEENCIKLNPFSRLYLLAKGLAVWIGFLYLQMLSFAIM